MKKNALTYCLTEATKELEEIKITSSKPEMLCNYTNPVSNLIFRINVNLRKVRIFVRKQFTDILNIIVSENYQEPEGFAKFNTAKELKDFYIDFYSHARKCRSNETFKNGPAHLNTSSAYLQNPSDLASKKSKKADDEDYHEDDKEEEE